MIDFKQEINKYKSIRNTDDVSGDITTDVQDILDLLKQVSSRPTVIKSTGAAPQKTVTTATPRTVTKPIASIVPKPTQPPVSTTNTNVTDTDLNNVNNVNEDSTNTVD